MKNFKFQIESDFIPKGDQPTAIESLTKNIKLENKKFQTLLGATGTGKTFTIAHLIQETQKPALIMAPNKTLAAQLYNELKELFPNNSVQFFVSYYDYYQPEAFLPISGQYIEKDFSVNEEIERLRLAAAYAIRTRTDTIIVATVSCIYGVGDPEYWEEVTLYMEVGMELKRDFIIKKLIKMNYERKGEDFKPGIVRVRGDTIDVYPAYAEIAIRISLFGDEIECNSFVPFQAFLRQTDQVPSDLGMRDGSFSKSHPRCANLLILVREPQSDAAAIACCCEVHVQVASNVQVREPRQKMH